ncbi:hypothetical protein ACFL59_16220 [Planctomycetota bacterium]
MHGNSKLGEIAIAKGYICKTRLHWGLERQKILRDRGVGPSLIGEILLEMGLLTCRQLSHVLAVSTAETAQRTDGPGPFDCGTSRLHRRMDESLHRKKTIAGAAA